MGEIEEIVLFGFDPAEQKVHHFGMNQYAVRDHTGDWRDEDTLYVEYNGQLGNGRAFREGITIAFVSPDRLEASVLDEEDGRITVTTALTLMRNA